MRPKKYFFSKKKSKIFFEKKIFFQIFPIVVPWIFLSLRYGADLGRSRLVFFFSWQSHSEWSTFFYNLSSFFQLIFWEAGDRWFDSRTKPHIVYASKSRCETKGFFRLVFLFGFFPALCDFFSENFRILSKGTPCIFWSFRFVKLFNEPEWPLFEFFGIVRPKKYFFSKKKSKIFFEKKIFFQIFPIVVPWIFLSLRYGADLGRSRLVFFFSWQSHSEWSTFFYNLSSFFQLIFWEAGDRWFDSRTKPHIVYASKSRCETKGFFRLVFLFGFFPALCDFFSENFRILSKGTPCIFWSFRFVKLFNEPEWPLFEFFGIVRLKKILFFEKKLFKNNFFDKNLFFANVSNSCSLKIFQP